MNCEELIPAISALKTIISSRRIATIDCTEETIASCKAALLLLESVTPAIDGLYTLEFDGASKGNPGPAGLGVVIYDPSGSIVEKLGKALGEATNNVAEYKALLAGLALARRMGIKHLAILTDSELVVRQLYGEYKIRKPELIKLATEAFALLREFDSYTIKHIPREQNSLADRLASSAIKLKAEKDKEK